MASQNPNILSPHVSVPLYKQLKELLREKVVSGQWERGHQIPSESQLCANYGVSRITVRQAIDGLVAEGWVHRLHGKGTFVRNAKPEIGLTPLFFLHRRNTAFENAPIHTLLSSGKITPAQTVRDALTLNEAEDVFEISRIRIMNNEPGVLEAGFVPLKLMQRPPTRKEEEQSYFYDILRSCTGVAPARTRINLEAVMLGLEEASALNATVNSPALRLERLTTSVEGKPVLFTRNIMAGHQCRYFFDLELPAST